MDKEVLLRNASVVMATLESSRVESVETMSPCGALGPWIYNLLDGQAALASENSISDFQTRWQRTVWEKPWNKLLG